jgi:hypothetical protein
LGDALAAGNFGKGAYADLAIGVPGRSIDGDDYAGSVRVIYGTSTGLSSSGSQLWYQDKPGIADDTDYDDRFGGAVAAGNFGNGSGLDLAIGAWGEDYDSLTPDAGVVHVLYGNDTYGLTAAGADFWHQDMQLEDEPEDHDMFGRSLGP